MKYFVISVITTIIIFIIIVVGTVIFYTITTCNKISCKNVVLDIKSSLDFEVDPCVDFYRFVCGKTLNTATMPSKVYQRHREQLERILRSPMKLDSPRAFFTSQSFLQRCYSYQQSNDHIDQIKCLFKEMGGFPTIEGDNWTESEWSWLETISKIRKQGLLTDGLFSLSLGYNPNNLAKVIPHLSKPKLTLTLICEEAKTTCFSLYATQFIETVVSLGANKWQATQDAIQLFHFERQLLIKTTQNPSAATPSRDLIMTISNLSKAYDFIDWRMFFKIMTKNQTKISEDLVVLVRSPDYLESLRSVLRESPKRLLANFIIWSNLYHLRDYLPGNVKSFECFRFLESTLPILLQAIFMAEQNKGYFDIEEGNSTVIFIFDLVKVEMQTAINRTVRIDNLVRQQMLEKINQTVIKVKFPDILLNNSFIDEYYKDLSSNSDSVLLTAIHIQRLFVDKLFEHCWKAKSEIFTIMSDEIYIPNVFYSLTEKAVVVLPGLLSDPIYDNDFPNYILFGIIGSLIAHELFHSIDSIAFPYDLEGNFKENLVSSYSDNFKNEMQCFVDQYSQLMELKTWDLDKNPRISGESKKVEIIADSIGLALSYRAYKGTLSSTLFGLEQLMPNVNFTQDQLFFISYAMFYCVQYSMEDVNPFSLLLDVHAPNPYRTNNPLQNNKHFSDAFSCELFSPMNPVNKCKLL